jgi:hypothetical protein
LGPFSTSRPTKLPASAHSPHKSVANRSSLYDMWVWSVCLIPRPCPSLAAAALWDPDVRPSSTESELEQKREVTVIRSLWFGFDGPRSSSLRLYMSTVVPVNIRVPEFLKTGGCSEVPSICKEREGAPRAALVVGEDDTNHR